MFKPFLLEKVSNKVRTWRNENENTFPLSLSTAKGHPLLNSLSELRKNNFWLKDLFGI